MVLEHEVTLIGSRGSRRCTALFNSGARFSDEFILLDGSSEEVIIGATTMQKWRISLDFDADVVRYRKTAERLRIV